MNNGEEREGMERKRMIKVYPSDSTSHTSFANKSHFFQGRKVINVFFPWLNRGKNYCHLCWITLRQIEVLSPSLSLSSFLSLSIFYSPWKVFSLSHLSLSRITCHTFIHFRFEFSSLVSHRILFLSISFFYLLFPLISLCLISYWITIGIWPKRKNVRWETENRKNWNREREKNNE